MVTIAYIDRIINCMGPRTWWAAKSTDGGTDIRTIRTFRVCIRLYISVWCGSSSSFHSFFFHMLPSVHPYIWCSFADDGNKREITGNTMHYNNNREYLLQIFPTQETYGNQKQKKNIYQLKYEMIKTRVSNRKFHLRGCERWSLIILVEF